MVPLPRSLHRILTATLRRFRVNLTSTGAGSRGVPRLLLREVDRIYISCYCFSIRPVRVRSLVAIFGHVNAERYLVVGERQCTVNFYSLVRG